MKTFPCFEGFETTNTSTIISHDKWLHFWFCFMFRSIDHTNKNLCFLHRKSFKSIFFPVTSALTRFSTNLFFMKSTFGNVTVLTIDRKMNRDIHESLSDNSCVPKKNRNCVKLLTPLENFKDLFLKFLLCRQQLHFHAA